MKRRVLISIAAFVVLGVCLWLTLRPVEPEPGYQGKMLSEWLAIYDPTNTYFPIQQARETQTAIREMGTNCLPALLRMLEQTDSPLKLKLIALAQKQSLFKVSHVPDVSRYVRAANGLELLGPRAVSAVPELIRIYDQNPSPVCQAEIATVLAGIGPPAKAAVPSLLRGATNSTDFVRGYAIEALGRIHSQPEVVVPVLIKALQDSYPGSRFSAAQGLGFYGREAKAAVPALIQFLEAHPQPPAAGLAGGITEHDTAVVALWKIDPETAAKAGIK